MSTTFLGNDKLLQYNSEYGVLICRECEYAIQKSAIESHLLKHKIYRGERHDLLARIAKLNVLDPDDVPQPAPGTAAIEALPISTGYRCTEPGCAHLTISEKRIKRHWSDTHGLGESTPPLSSFACLAQLQTFFRGTKLRYFEVTAPTGQLTSDDELQQSSSSQDSFRRQSSLMAPDVVSSVSTNALANSKVKCSAPLAHGSSTAMAELDLATMTYFFHLATVTSRILPGSTSYWQNVIIPKGLRHDWLMHGLLAIAAQHMAVLSNDPLGEQLHRQRVNTLYARFTAGMERNMTYLETDQETAETAVRVQSLLKLSQLSDPTSRRASDLEARHNAFDIISLLRNCIIQDSAHSSNLPLETPVDNFAGFDNDGNAIFNRPPQPLLDHLQTLPTRMAESLDRPDGALPVLATMSAIAILLECCTISFASEDAEAAWSGTERWLTKISGFFYGMLNCNDPAALVVLAHWAAVLVKRAERMGCWFIKGAARNIVMQVVSELSAINPTILCLLDKLQDEV